MLNLSSLFSENGKVPQNLRGKPLYHYRNVLVHSSEREREEHVKWHKPILSTQI